MSNSELDLLGIVGCRDNNARRFARVRIHYYSRRYEKTTFFSNSGVQGGATAEIKHLKHCHSVGVPSFYHGGGTQVIESRFYDRGPNQETGIYAPAYTFKAGSWQI